jgi:RNA polymerase sigma factor (TIGR02999 family)
MDGNPENTDALLKRAQSGDVEAREALAAHLRPCLLSLVQTRLAPLHRERHDIESLVEATLARAMIELKDCGPRGDGSLPRLLWKTLLRLLREADLRADRQVLTESLKDATSGSAVALNDVFEACYAELLQLAHRYLASERPDHTLQTAALVHEAYLRLFDSAKLSWRDRCHFFRIAALVMRRILLDYARRRGRDKRLGKLQRVPLDEAAGIPFDAFEEDLMSLDKALSRLQVEAPDEAEILELHFFAGMAYHEISEKMGLKYRTVRRRMAYALARLQELMQEPGS